MARQWGHEGSILDSGLVKRWKRENVECKYIFRKPKKGEPEKFKKFVGTGSIDLIHFVSPLEIIPKAVN